MFLEYRFFLKRQKALEPVMWQLNAEGRAGLRALLWAPLQLAHCLCILDCSFCAITLPSSTSVWLQLNIRHISHRPRMMLCTEHMSFVSQSFYYLLSAYGCALLKAFGSCKLMIHFYPDVTFYIFQNPTSVTISNLQHQRTIPSAGSLAMT